MEVPVSGDADIDKEKLTIELLNNFRKDAVVFIDIKNDPKGQYSTSADVRFIGVKIQDRIA